MGEYLPRVRHVDESLRWGARAEAWADTNFRAQVKTQGFFQAPRARWGPGLRALSASAWNSRRCWPRAGSTQACSSTKSCSGKQSRGANCWPWRRRRLARPWKSWSRGKGDARGWRTRRTPGARGPWLGLKLPRAQTMVSFSLARAQTFFSLAWGNRSSGAWKRQWASGASRPATSGATSGRTLKYSVVLDRDYTEHETGAQLVLPGGTLLKVLQISLVLTCPWCKTCPELRFSHPMRLWASDSSEAANEFYSECLRCLGKFRSEDSAHVKAAKVEVKEFLLHSLENRALWVAKGCSVLGPGRCEVSSRPAVSSGGKAGSKTGWLYRERQADTAARDCPGRLLQGMDRQRERERNGCQCKWWTAHCLTISPAKGVTSCRQAQMQPVPGFDALPLHGAVLDSEGDGLHPLHLWRSALTAGESALAAAESEDLPTAACQAQQAAHAAAQLLSSGDHPAFAEISNNGSFLALIVPHAEPLYHDSLGVLLICGLIMRHGVQENFACLCDMLNSSSESLLNVLIEITRFFHRACFVCSPSALACLAPVSAVWLPTSSTNLWACCLAIVAMRFDFTKLCRKRPGVYQDHTWGRSKSPGDFLI